MRCISTNLEKPQRFQLKTTYLNDLNLNSSKSDDVLNFRPQEIPSSLLVLLTSNNQSSGSAVLNEGQNALAPTLVICARFTWLKVKRRVIRSRVIEGRKERNQIPFILSWSPNECWFHTCQACVVATWRLGSRSHMVNQEKNKAIDSHDGSVHAGKKQF